MQVGEVIKVEKDHYFPADLLLVSSTNDDGIAYVETMNLDGETNLKIKKTLDQTKGITEQNVKDLKVTFKAGLCVETIKRSRCATLKRHGLAEGRNFSNWCMTSAWEQCKMLRAGHVCAAAQTLTRRLEESR